LDNMSVVTVTFKEKNWEKCLNSLYCGLKCRIKNAGLREKKKRHVFSQVVFTSFKCKPAIP